MAVISFKCPNCDGELIFDPETQKYKCEYCGSKFTQAELDALQPAESEETDAGAADGSDEAEQETTEQQSADTKKKEGPKSMDEVDPELIKTFNKLGIPLEEQMALSGMAVDAVMDSVSVKTTFKETLLEKGIIFCSFSEGTSGFGTEIYGLGSGLS